jgi:hypothetical protein
VELRQHIADVALHCLFRDDKPTGDLAVGQSVGDQLEDVSLTRGWLQRSHVLKLPQRNHVGDRSPRSVVEPTTVSDVSAQDLTAFGGVHAFVIGIDRGDLDHFS